MKKDRLTKGAEANVEQMTFARYYQTIPRFPKKDFIHRICGACEVNENTVRNWLFGRAKPQKPSHYRILSELTGIPVENLFPEE